MPDSNPTLTASLMGERTQLMGERSDILRRISELNSLLEMNSTQIEATDTLMLRFNADHVSIDVRTDLEGSPLVTVQRAPLQLASSTSEAAIAQAAPPATADTDPEATTAVEPKQSASKLRKPKKEAKRKASSRDSSKISTAEEASAVDAATGTKSGKSQVMQEMTEYFRKSNRSETILQILMGMTEPVSAKTVAGHYRALFPLPNDSKPYRSLHNSRVSAALHYLKDRGQAVRSATEKAGGKIGSDVRWELSKSYRSDLKKAKKAQNGDAKTSARGRKLNGHASLPPVAADAPQHSTMAH